MIEIRNTNMGSLSCVQIKNMTEGDIALDEGVVVGMNVDAFGAPDFNLLGDINFQTTRNDLDAKCTGNDLGFGTEYMCAETKDETAQVLCFYDMEQTEPTMFVFEHIGADGELDASCFDF